MADKPMIFSAPMVRALLEGRKTMTRRMLKAEMLPGANPNFSQLRAYPYGQGRWQLHGSLEASKPFAVSYAVGDRLWVRESGYERPERTPRMMRDGADTWERFYYRADMDASEREMLKGWGFKSRPSIHMPRWASRLTLIVTAVKVERLQEISEEDAQAEGAEPMLVPPDGGSAPHVKGFQSLWNSINGPGAWGANPWVVALTFSVHQTNIHQMKEAA